MKVFYILLAFLLPLGVAAQAITGASTVVQGVVRAAESRAGLPGAQLELVELGLTTTTNPAGTYRFQLPATALFQLTLRVTAAGKQDVEVTLKLQPGLVMQRDVQLPARSLALADVQVNAQRSGQEVSNSAVVIGREAIAQTQAYSLADVLQLLPGKTITNANLQGAQAVPLRTMPITGAISPNEQRPFLQNNAFGTAILVDGGTWGNNGNMQALDPGSNGVPQFQGFTVPSGRSGNDYASGAYAGSSLDLKQIPANNIESVEIIQGVASARYGDLSTGAIIVNRQAGRTPYRAAVRAQSGTTEVSASKGIGLANGNALNVSATFLNSNPEPQLKTKSANRVSLNTIYTNYFGAGRRHRNSLSLDATWTLDGAKTDADDQGTSRTFTRDHSLRLADRGTLNFLKPWSEYVSYQVGGSYAYQDDYTFLRLNTEVQPVTNAQTTGTHAGTFAPSVYEFEGRILGKPVNLYARADNTVLFATGRWTHTLTAGASVSYDRNYGAGRQFDPLRPRINTLDGLGERPYDFRSVPGLLQAGAFLENQVVREWGPRKLVANLGVRFDRQNGFVTLAPRFNAKFYLRKGVQLNAAYGLAAKAPGLIQRYPGLLYFDVPLLVSYNGFVNQSVYLVHTEVVNPANPNLRPAKARTLELGLYLQSPRGYGLALTGYRKQDIDGFGTSSQLLQLTLPDYAQVGRTSAGVPIVQPTGTSRNYNYNYRRVTNSLGTSNYGLELQLRTPKLRSLQTSFDLSSAFTSSRNFYTDGRVALTRQNAAAVASTGIEYIAREPIVRQSSSAVSTLSSSTHLARLGLVVTLRGQLFWGVWSNNVSLTQDAIGFYRLGGEYVALTAEDYASGRYNNLRQDLTDDLTQQNFIYGNLHLRLAKDLGKLCRLSFFANNFLNIRPEQYRTPTGAPTVYNQDPTFGSELVITW